MIVRNGNHLFQWYLLVWLGYLFLLFIVPAESAEHTYLLGLFLTFCYLLTSAAVFLAVQLHFPANDASVVVPTATAFLSEAPNLLKVVTVFTLAGLTLHLYDKIVLMELDYSKGIASARYAWMAAGSARDPGIASWQSAVGHLLTNFYFAGALLSLLFWERHTPALRLIGILVSTTAMLVYAATMANRSVPLVYIASCGAVVLLRRSMKLPALPLSRSLKRFALTSFLLLVTYALYVFSERASLADDLVKHYTLSFYNQLGARPTSSFEFGDKLPSPFSELYYLVLLAILYIVHTQWTFDYVLTLIETPGGTLFNTIFGGLAKIGVEEARGYFEDRAFSGVLLSLPGGAWYDFGPVGLLVIASLHGASISWAYHCLRRKVTFGRIAFSLTVGVFSLLAPLTSFANLMVFPFFLFSFLAVWMLSTIKQVVWKSAHQEDPRQHRASSRQSLS